MQGDSGLSRAVDPISESAPSVAEQEPQHSAHANNDLEQTSELDQAEALPNGDAAAHAAQSSESRHREGYRDSNVQEGPSEDPADTSKAGTAVSYCAAPPTSNCVSTLHQRSGLPQRFTPSARAATVHSMLDMLHRCRFSNDQ